MARLSATFFLPIFLLIFPYVCGFEWTSLLHRSTSELLQSSNVTRTDVYSETFTINQRRKSSNLVTMSWLSGGRPAFLIADIKDSMFSVSMPSMFESAKKGFLGVPSCLHQPTQHPYSERSTAKEADSAGRTSNEWNFWLTLLIAMVAAAILS